MFLRLKLLSFAGMPVSGPARSIRLNARRRHFRFNTTVRVARFRILLGWRECSRQIAVEKRVDHPVKLGPWGFPVAVPTLDE